MKDEKLFTMKRMEFMKKIKKYLWADSHAIVCVKSVCTLIICVL